MTSKTKKQNMLVQRIKKDSGDDSLYAEEVLLPLSFRLNAYLVAKIDAYSELAGTTKRAAVECILQEGLSSIEEALDEAEKAEVEEKTILAFRKLVEVQ